MKTPLLAAVTLSLLSVPALAADLGVPYGKAPVAARFAWTSCYAGGLVGGGFGQKDLTDSAGFLAGLGGPGAASLDTSGYMLGGQIGCDYQFGSGLVLGIEGTGAGANIGGSTVVAVPGDNATFKQTTDFLTTGVVRVGLAWDRFLPYVNGGVVWAGDRYSVFDAAALYDAEAVETRLGWTVGAGIEWALGDDWSVKLEYDYYGLGNRSVTFIDNVSGAFGPVDVKQSIQVVKLGINFHVWASDW
jgi:opacity protein-like surface antigen